MGGADRSYARWDPGQPQIGRLEQMAGREIAGGDHDGDAGAFGVLAEEQDRGRHRAQAGQNAPQQDGVRPRGPVLECLAPGVTGTQPPPGIATGPRAYTTHGPSVGRENPAYPALCATVDKPRPVDESEPGSICSRSARLPAQLAAAAGVDEDVDEPLSEPEDDEAELELSDFAGSLAVDAPLRLSVR